MKNKVNQIEVHGNVKNDTYHTRVVSNSEYTSQQGIKGLKVDLEVIVKNTMETTPTEYVIKKSVFLMNNFSFNKFADAVATIKDDYLTTDEVLITACNGFEMLVTFKDGYVYSWQGEPLPDEE